MSLATQSHRAWLMKMARESDRERLRRVREKLQEARGRKRAAKADARATCLAARDQVRAWAKAERERLQLEIVKLRGIAKQTCVLGREKVEANEGAAVRSALAELENERDNRRLVKLAKGNAQLKLPPVAKKDRESDNERDIVGSLDDEQLIVWNKVRGRIKANDRMTRLEAFEHWLHENPGEVAVILSKHYEQDVERFVKEEEQQRKAMQVDYRKLTDTQLSDRIERTAKPDAPKLPAPKAAAASKPKPKRKLSGRPLAIKTKKPKGKLRPKTVAPGKGTAAPRAASSRASAASKRKLSRVGVRGAAKPKGKVRPKGKKLAPGTVLIRYGVGLDDAGSYFPIWMPENATEPVRIMFNGSELKDALESAKWKAEEDASGYRGVPVVVEQLPLPRKAGPSSYEQRQQARRERMQGRAGKLAQVADAKLSAARRIGSHIPFGQPILVGHHSEKRARRDIKRIDQNMRAGIEASKKAEHLASRAANVGRAGIASDDPEAVKKLKQKLEGLIASRDDMKAMNAHARKHGIESTIEAFPGSREAITSNMRFSSGRKDKPFPTYVFTNLSSEIRRVQQRIDDTAKLHSTGDREIQGNGYTISEDAEAGRVFVRFDARQPSEVTKHVKSNGFVWARSQSAWVRKRTANAWAAAGNLHAALIRELGSSRPEDDDAPDPGRMWNDTSAELMPMSSRDADDLEPKRTRAPKRPRRVVPPGMVGRQASARPKGKLKVAGKKQTYFAVVVPKHVSVGDQVSVPLGEHVGTKWQVFSTHGSSLRGLADASAERHGGVVVTMSKSSFPNHSDVLRALRAQVKAPPRTRWSKSAARVDRPGVSTTRKPPKRKGKVRVRLSGKQAAQRLITEADGVVAARQGYKVIVRRSESAAPGLQPGKQYPTLDSFSGAMNRALREYPPTSAYDKIDFAINAGVGIYEGRYDLGENGETRANVAVHMERVLQRRLVSKGFAPDEQEEARAWLAFVRAVRGEVPASLREAAPSRAPSTSSRKASQVIASAVSAQLRADVDEMEGLIQTVEPSFSVDRTKTLGAQMKQIEAAMPRDFRPGGRSAKSMSELKERSRASSRAKVSNPLLAKRAASGARAEDAAALERVSAGVRLDALRKQGRPSTVEDFLQQRMDIDRDGLAKRGEHLRFRLSQPKSMTPPSATGVYGIDGLEYALELSDTYILLKRPGRNETMRVAESNRVKPNELMVRLRKETDLWRQADAMTRERELSPADLDVIEQLHAVYRRDGMNDNENIAHHRVDAQKYAFGGKLATWLKLEDEQLARAIYSRGARALEGARNAARDAIKWANVSKAKAAEGRKAKKTASAPVSRRLDAESLEPGDLLELTKDFRTSENKLVPKGALLSFQRKTVSHNKGWFVEVMDDDGERIRLNSLILKRAKQQPTPF